MVERQPGAEPRIHNLRESCTSCSLNDLCLPVALDAAGIETLDGIVQRGHPLVRGQIVYHPGKPFHSVYAVRAGALKSVTVTEDGEEQITAFHLPGELVGLDAIGFDAHPSTAAALETTRVCEIPFAELEGLSEHVHGLRRHLVRRMSQAIAAEQEMLHLLARRNAEQRLAAFLVHLSDRHVQRGLAATPVRLPMSRHELGNYLGLVPETVSRLFRRFMDHGWMSVQGQSIGLDNPGALRLLTRSSSQVVQEHRT
ncbi:fumarate/nitrate reduction transcriptional regulator Fnr [Aquisalimonas lutea]|uniref:fumarate/nitrate reduction transcriptional regulator Fnr n=1 Tax=Aquisalimonas lutea TaxID=1327750 RepID=UPI0025B4ACFE|nr:fumarate/nitrate reduction transcriptional regulator Fnr [Aquisalimonas lutea]MDN3519766.1 fumarate/nitrate reduction transcriptional regulator Fnr [Aquisalimonas lutea]